MALPLWKQTDVVEEIADKTGISKGEIKNVLNALEETVFQALKQPARVKIGNIVQLEPKLKKASKKRKGRNPATGEEVMIGAKPASVRVAARVLKSAKDAAPSVKKLTNSL